MSSFRKSSPLIFAAAAAVCVSGFSVPAMAAETTVDNISNAALDSLGVQVSDPAVLAQINNDLAAALEAGIVDQSVIDYTTDPNAPTHTVTPTDTPAPIDTSIPEPIPTDTAAPTDGNVFNHHHDNEVVNWDQVRQDWLTAFDAVKTDYDSCIAAGGTADECVKNIGFKMQIAHGEAVLNSYDARIADIANLPVDQQADALQHLEQQRARVVERLGHANALLQDSITNGTPLPQGVKIKDLPGEADFVNGLLAELGSSELAIPHGADHVEHNSDGTVTILNQDGSVKTFTPNPERQLLNNPEHSGAPATAAPVNSGVPNVQGSVSGQNGGQPQPQPSRTEQPRQGSTQQGAPQPPQNVNPNPRPAESRTPQSPGEIIHEQDGRPAPSPRPTNN